MMRTTKITNRHLIALRLKLDNLKESKKQKLACKKPNCNKSVYAYVRRKQNVQDKVGPLEDSAGNI